MFILVTPVDYGCLTCVGFVYVLILITDVNVDLFLLYIIMHIFYILYY
jgi:hypothetical protein